MHDICERLRSTPRADIRDLMSAAANEIERLRDELASATRHMELAEAAWLRETVGNPPVTEPLPK